MNVRINIVNAGKVQTQTHRLPYGGLFEYISSPHYACEIGIYLCLYCIMGGYWRAPHLVTMQLLFVVNNQVRLRGTCVVKLMFMSDVLLQWQSVSLQVLSALLSHRWYKEKFGDVYPKRRAALLPMIL